MSFYPNLYRRRAYNANHLLLRLIEQWRSALDVKIFIGAVLMDPKLLTASLMLYSLQNYMLMALEKTLHKT